MDNFSFARWVIAISVYAMALTTCTMKDDIRDIRFSLQEIARKQ